MSEAATRRAARATDPDGDPEDGWWLCPGPEWGTEQETCGRMMRRKNERCDECSARRTSLRKRERAIENRPRGFSPADADADSQPWNMWA